MMSKKLSELKDTDILLVGEDITEKEELLNDWEYYKGKEIYTTKQYKANISAEDMLDNALECEYQNMYESWYEEVWKDVTETDIKDLQSILDRILSRSKNIAYIEDKKVEIDI